MDSNWQHLPSDILCLILDKLFASPCDYIKFSVVCKSWYYISKEKYHNRQLVPLPMLLVPTKDNRKERRSLYNIANNKIDDLEIKAPHRRCCGSSQGWLIFTYKDNCMLLNPFNSETICLPPMTTKYPAEDDETYPYEYHFKKAILTADPSLHPNDYIVAAIYYGMSGMCKLAIFKADTKEWSNIPDLEEINVFQDIIYYKGRVHAIDYNAGLGKIDFINNKGDKEDSLLPQLNVVAPRQLPPNCVRCMYIVETTRGDLVLVKRILDKLEDDDEDLPCLTCNFKIFKLVHSEDQHLSKWVEIESLGDDAFFLGENYSISVSSFNSSGCQSNCIYYTDDDTDTYRDKPQGPCDAGIFNLQNKSITSHYVPGPLHKDMPPPIWITPILQPRS